ncbi:MAG: hypothetical protein KDA42_10155, partial [Planctomycetales bacterium]|nr:hypothetical protein [Planctomycetales bacterium]
MGRSESNDVDYAWRQSLHLLIAAGICGIVAAARVQAAPAGPTEAIDAMRGDAALNDVCFVDARTGWAVGDRGAIWHTADSGRNWSLQESNVACSLASVFFLDAERGWIAGGFTHPFTLASEGVLLETRDGGRNWTRREGLTLPALRRIKFFNAREGIAIGEASALFPAGVFRTGDGGASWEPIPSRLGLAWQTGDFIDPTTGALASRNGRTATLRRRTIDGADAPSLGLRSIRDLQLVEPVHGFAVGDGGLVMSSRDLGRTWQTSAFELP